MIRTSCFLLAVLWFATLLLGCSGRSATQSWVEDDLVDKTFVVNGPKKVFSHYLADGRVLTAFGSGESGMVFSIYYSWKISDGVLYSHLQKEKVLDGGSRRLISRSEGSFLVESSGETLTMERHDMTFEDLAKAVLDKSDIFQ